MSLILSTQGEILILEAVLIFTKAMPYMGLGFFLRCGWKRVSLVAATGDCRPSDASLALRYYHAVLLGLRFTAELVAIVGHYGIFIDVQTDVVDDIFMSAWFYCVVVNGLVCNRDEPPTRWLGPGGATHV